MIVTYLEMTQRAAPRPAPPPDAMEVVRWSTPDLETYRHLQRKIGSEWLWAKRLRLADSTLAAAVSGDDVEIWRLMDGDEARGFAEISFKKAAEAELAFFGVAPGMVGTTAARCLMNVAIARAWARPIKRFHLNTCTLDHPKALAFYRRSGFREYKRAVETMRDPRLDGTLPRDAAPNIAILE